MKKQILSMAVLALLSFGCSQNSTKETGHDESVPHEHTEEAHDESVPHEHAEDKEAPSPKQEEFNVETDTAGSKKTSKTHSHDGEAEHGH